MPLYLVIEGMLIGIVVAVPVGPLGLLCINRALMMGPVCGLFSGLGVATADEGKWARASAGLTKELERSTALGAGAVCFHPGSASDGDVPAAPRSGMAV